MSESPFPLHPAPLSAVEPHAGLLRVPAPEQPLYKVMSVKSFLASVTRRYLHFNRVDGYQDFPGADHVDASQLPTDRPGNALSTFVKAPDFTAADYYDRCRSRTYACCFSLENSDFIWQNYGGAVLKEKIGVVFHFGKLRSLLNRTFAPGHAQVMYRGLPCHQIFDLNYGMVDYVDLATYQANAKQLPNQIIYTYLKDSTYHQEKEQRISLSAIGMGHFQLNDGSRMEFDRSLQVPFNFASAMAEGAIQTLIAVPGFDFSAIREELLQVGIDIAEAPSVTRD